MPTLKPDRPLDPLAVAVIREVDKLLKELKLTYLVCGAMARDILLQHLYGIATGTATVDVDFGVAVENWGQFNLIKARLVETRKFEAEKKRHTTFTTNREPHGEAIRSISSPSGK